MPLDIASVRLIEARQRAAGWPKAVRGPRALGAAQPFDALANMRTNAQARGVLGIAAKWLQQAYGILDTFTMWPTGTTKESARELLNRTNAYAQKVYAKLPNDTAPIDPMVRKQVVVATSQAATNLKLVSDVRNNLNQGFLTDVVDYLNSGVHRVVNDVIDQVTGKKKLEVTRILIWAAVGTVGLGVVIMAAKLVHTAVLGNMALGEAEEAAVTAAEEERRRAEQRKQAKTVVSIS